MRSKIFPGSALAASSSAGFSLISILVAAGIVALASIVVVTGLVQNIDARKSSRMGQASRDVAQAFESAVADEIRKVLANRCVDPQQIKTTFQNRDIAGLVSATHSTQPLPPLVSQDPNAAGHAGASARCGRKQVLNGSSRATYFCLKLAPKAGLAESNESLAKAEYLFAEVLAEVRDLSRNQRIPCSSFGAGTTGSGAVVYYQMYWALGKGAKRQMKSHGGVYYVAR